FVPYAERWPRARRRLATRSRVDPPPSSEAEIGHPLEGRSAALERGGDCPPGLRGMRMGRMLGFFESFPFLFRRSRPWAFVGSVVLSGVCVLKVVLVPQLGCP